MQILAKRLQRQVKTAVKRLAPFAPAWSQPVLSQIAVSPAHKDNLAKRNAAERQLGQGGKLLQARRGEVPERRNAAVC